LIADTKGVKRVWVDTKWI